MRGFIYTFFLWIFVISCSTINKKHTTISNSNTNSDTLRIANDSLEYEIMIIEPGFNSWILTQRPRGFYTETFLENRNRIYVTEYNQRVLQPQRFDPLLYEQQINYDPTISYGYEVNYLLYNYFIYFEQQFNQRFIATRGRRY
ncbi:DUF6146 family protein [Aquimarina muelleri]|uniref:Lipoprotein n=1 Tax=Aquimarina muelleri TaxID=279356 RepID=A0A918JSU4_9FLAO|nr:DUF6146 family protein [Aquimarina muelleri]MCX2762084.1 DUF6146 family protein [Aquimarina muelleri]GGX04335.1 hypothetical protein GCM10007384_02660 [Aquimarina muelleri]